MVIMFIVLLGEDRLTADKALESLLADDDDDDDSKPDGKLFCELYLYFYCLLHCKFLSFCSNY